MSRALSTTYQQGLEEIDLLCRSKTFLGPEFLLWLWFESETQTFPIELDLQGRRWGVLKVTVWVQDKVSFEGSSHSLFSARFTGDKFLQAPEVRLALRAGKRIKQLKLGLEIEDWGEAEILLSADSMHSACPISVEYTPQNPKDDFREDLEQRLEGIQASLEIVDELFRLFLKARLNSPGQSDHEIELWRAAQPVAI